MASVRWSGGHSSSPLATRVPHTRVRLGRSKNVIYSTYQHVVELYGPQIPVSVAESLHYTPGAKRTASVGLNSECGWAWYVCGRKLLVWHNPASPNSEATVLAKEMTLPSSGLSHHARLVAVFKQPNQIAPSCIGVSPEGVIRYWEVIGHHSSWIDVNANLGGEEVCGVEYLGDVGCVAVTTSGTMLIVSPRVVKGSATVATVFVSRMPKWFDTLGRRVSSIIFGANTSQPPIESRLVKVLTSSRVSGLWHIFMVAGFTLHSWVIETDGVSFTKVYECDLEPIIKRAFPEEVANDPNCEIMISDVRLSETGSITCLVVSSEPRIYLILELNGNQDVAPDAANGLCILSQDNVAVFEEESRIAHLNFLLLPTTALVFNKSIIFAVPLSGGEESVGEPLDLPGGAVLGGSMHNNTPIFFCPTYGFVSVTPVNTGFIDVINTTSLDTQVTPQAIMAREPDVLSAASVESVRKLKLAFIHFIRKNKHLCLDVIKREFVEEWNEEDVDSQLAATLVKVSLDIINDFSPKDHRWGEVKDDYVISRSKSLHLDTQLREKKQAHDIYLQFAKAVSSTIDLGKVSRRGRAVRTIHLLYEHNEKVLASLVLKKLQQKFPYAIGNCANVASHHMQFQPTHEIPATDFFFRYVSIVDEGLKNLISKCVDLSCHNLGSSEFSKLLIVTNRIIIAVFSEILNVRSKRGYLIDRSYVPWLAASEPGGIFDHLAALAHTNYVLLSRFGEQTHRYAKIMNQFFNLCNIVLYVQIEHMERSDFKELSSSIIKFFIDCGFHAQALQLAYKYKNFEYLTKLTYFMNQEPQINTYIDLFADEGFCFDLFNYLYESGKYEHLLSLDLGEKYVAQLEVFIEQFPALNWLYRIRNQDYQKANQILMEFSNDENTTLKTQEIMFNFAKLTALAGACPDLSEINRNIEILSYQKDIPVGVFVRKGYDVNTLKVLPATDLIELLIGEENVDGDEYDFKRALELLKFIDDPEQHESLRKKIWRSAIEKDEWESISFDFTPKIVGEIFFFSVMKLVKSSDEKLQNLIPTTEELIDDPDFAMFRKKSASTYLLEYGYELILASDSPQFHHHLDYLDK